jgi:photosystem II stability/assembly factor-like uncharacterized protein
MMKQILCVFMLSALVGLVHAGTWTDTNNGFATIACAISFTSDTNGLAPVADNGQGSMILSTTDGGTTWNPVPALESLMFLGGAAQANTDGGASGAMSAMFTIVYSDKADGTFNFTDSVLPGGVTSQNVATGKYFSDSFYGAAGTTMFGGNGVAVSQNSGAGFMFVNISILQTVSRYGAYPSANVWYVSAGEWPENKKDNDVSDEVYELTKRIRIHTNRTHNRPPQHSVRMSREIGDTIDNGWRAEIVKTSDGGKTWTSLFYDEGNFYFNQIDCADETHCCAVGEADASAAPGVRIYCTVDGTTFTQVYFNGVMQILV